MYEALVGLIPLVAAALTPPLVAACRQYVTDAVPPRWFPVLLPITGGFVAGVAHLVGVDAAVLQQTSAEVSAWETVVQGILVGSASVGVHQIKRQQQKTD